MMTAKLSRWASVGVAISTVACSEASLSESDQQARARASTDAAPSSEASAPEERADANVVTIQPEAGQEAAAAAPGETKVVDAGTAQVDASGADAAGIASDAGPASLSDAATGIVDGALEDAPSVPPGCAPALERCNEAAASAEYCDATGTWRVKAACTRLLQTCSMTSGAAACSDKAEFTLGDVGTEPEGAWQPWAVPNDQAYFIPVDLPVKASLNAFEFRAVADGGSCSMAIYGDAAGKPGKVLAESFSIGYVKAGHQTLEPNGHIPLQIGRYWIGGECFLHPAGVQLYKRASDAAYFKFSETGTYPNGPSGELLQGASFGFGVTVGRIP